MSVSHQNLMFLIICYWQIYLVILILAWRQWWEHSLLRSDTKKNTEEEGCLEAHLADGTPLIVGGSSFPQTDPDGPLHRYYALCWFSYKTLMFFSYRILHESCSFPSPCLIYGVLSTTAFSLVSVNIMVFLIQLKFLIHQSCLDESSPHPQMITALLCLNNILSILLLHYHNLLFLMFLRV